MNRRQFLHAGALSLALVAGCSSGGDGGDGDTDGPPQAPTGDGSPGDGSGGGGGGTSMDIDLGTLGPAGDDLEVTAFDYGPGEDGNLTVTVGAKNNDDEPVTVVLVQRATVGNDTHEQRRTLSLDSGGQRTVTVTFNVTMAEFNNASSIGIDGPQWEWPENTTGDGG